MRFRTFSRIAAVLLTVGALSAVSFAGLRPAAAQDGELAAPVIAVADIQKILQEAEASKGVQTAVGIQRDIYQKEITALEDKLRTAEQALRKQQTVLSPDALAQKRRDFEKQVGEVQRTVQSRKRALDTALNEAMSTVQKAMVDIIAEVARERGANMVLARHQFVIVDTKLDVTKTVLDRLNQKLPSVAVNIPKQ